jgi:hypothetical protein
LREEEILSNPLKEVHMKMRLLSLIAVCSLVGSIAEAQIQFSTYTGINGFYDYQTNYRTTQYIRACPGSSMIHAIMMVADDSLNPSTSRRTAYAFSSDGGSTWTTFNQIRVPDRRSGFPSLDIGQGPISCSPIVANHSTISAVLQSSIFVDAPPGGGAFAEIQPPYAFGGGDEPGFPEVAGTSDGGAILIASRLAGGTVHYTGTADFTSWQPWGTLTLEFFSDGYVAEGSSTGRVGVVVTSPGDPLYWYESTNNGVSWPSTPAELLPSHIPAGSDSFVVTQGLDLAYPARDTLVAFAATKIIDGNPTSRYSGIGFYSERTGFVLAVPHESVTGVVDTLRKRQVNQNPIGYPAIGMSTSTIVIAFQAFRAETSATGFNYADIFCTYSTNGGASWVPPINVTNTPTLDERYVSVSKWNPPGQAYVVYQEDPQPGSAVFGGDNSPQARVRQRFVRVSVPIGTGVDEAATAPAEFALHQNYPNPFNPSTTISYQLPLARKVTVKVFDVLGREVATLVNEIKGPGNHQVTFDAGQFANGVYIYRITAGAWTESRKMLLLK